MATVSAAGSEYLAAQWCEDQSFEARSITVQVVRAMDALGNYALAETEDLEET